MKKILSVSSIVAAAIGIGAVTYNKLAPIPVLVSSDIWVTSLADYDHFREKPIAGSLRDAIENSEGKFIKFKVGGPIALKMQLVCQRDNLLIDGGTAPNPGITLTRQQFTFKSCDNVHAQNIRFRCGDGYASDTDRKALHGQYDDYVNVSTDNGLRNETDTGGVRSLVVIDSSNIVIENCSIENSTDDNGNVWGKSSSVVFRYCLFAGGYANVYIEKWTNNAHKGFLAGVDNGTPVMSVDSYVTLDKCMFVDCYGRAPDLNGGVCNLLNCIIVGPVQGGVLTNSRCNIIGNFCETLQPHPWGDGADRILTAEDKLVADGSFYLSDNVVDGSPVKAIIGQKNLGQKDLSSRCFRTSPWALSTKLIVPAKEAFNLVTTNVGCISPCRDSLDADFVSKCLN